MWRQFFLSLFMLICRKICFAAIYLLLPFIQKLCVWRKKDKYQVCLCSPSSSSWRQALLQNRTFDLFCQPHCLSSNSIFLLRWTVSPYHFAFEWHKENMNILQCNWSCLCKILPIASDWKWICKTLCLAQIWKFGGGNKWVWELLVLRFHIVKKNHSAPVP